MVKVSNRPAVRTLNGLVHDLFNDLENTLMPYQGNAARQLPAANIIEDQEGYHAEVLAPGRKKENFVIGVEKNQLTISYSGETIETPVQWKQIRKEFSLGNFKRTFHLDETIYTENFEAKFDDGLRIFFLPKKAELKPVVRNIEVQ